MTKGCLSRAADERQASVENQMALLGAILMILEHDSLRVSQAIRRTGLDDLLGPVLDDHERIRSNIRAIQARLRQAWDAGQASRWSDSEENDETRFS